MKTPYRERLPDVPAAPVFPAATANAPRTRGSVVSGGDGRQAFDFDRTVNAVREFSPGLAEWLDDFSSAEESAQQGLDRRTRELATIAALASLGHAQPQLRARVGVALEQGCRPAHIVEVVLQVAVVAGLPATINALAIVREALVHPGASQ